MAKTENTPGMLPGAHTEEINMEITVNLTFSDAAEAARALASIAGVRAETPTPKAAEPKAAEPKADAPKADAPKADAPKAEAPKAEPPKAEAPAGVELVPYSQVADRIRGLAARADIGIPLAMAVLGRFGVKSGKELGEADYPEAVRLLDLAKGAESLAHFEELAG